MRILFVNENIGGHATVHGNLERAVREGHDLEGEFLHAPSLGWGRRVVGAGIPPLDRFDLDLQPLRAQLALSYLFRRRLKTALADFDAVHVYTHNAALLSAGLLREVPTVVTLDTTNAQNAYLLSYRRPSRWTGRLLPLTQRFEQKVYDAATVIVANSEWAAGSLLRDYAVPADKIRVLPFGIELPPERPAGTRNNGKPRIVFVGRSLERKGGRRLLRLHQERLRDLCRLILVTPEPVEPAEGVDIVSDVRAGDGRVLEILRTSDIFVFPSAIDMWSNAVMEAMASSLPVVALRVNAMAEMVPEDAGILVEPEDDDALVHAITSLIGNPELARRMGDAARRVAVTRYDIDETVVELTGILRDAIRLHHQRRTR